MKKKINFNSPRSKEDEMMDKLFVEAVRAAKKRSKSMGCAVAGYDSRKKKPFIDYPEKGRVYVEENA